MDYPTTTRVFRTSQRCTKNEICIRWIENIKGKRENAGWIQIVLKGDFKSDFVLSHNSPCFECNIAVTNFHTV